MTPPDTAQSKQTHDSAERLVAIVLLDTMQARTRATIHHELRHHAQWKVDAAIEDLMAAGVVLVDGPLIGPTPAFERLNRLGLLAV